MKYLCLAYYDEQAFEALPQAELDAIVSQCPRYDQELRDSGHLILQASLGPTRATMSLRPKGGKPAVTDGPFAETKEQLAGFYLIDAKDFEEAIELAARIPPARLGSVEVRPVWTYDGRDAR